MLAVPGQSARIASQSDAGGKSAPSARVSHCVVHCGLCPPLLAGDGQHYILSKFIPRALHTSKKNGDIQLMENGDIQLMHSYLRVVTSLSIGCYLAVISLCSTARLPAFPYSGLRYGKVAPVLSPIPPIRPPTPLGAHCKH